MTLKFNCWKCHTPQAAPDSFAGRKVKCEACRAIVTLPGDDEIKADRLKRENAQTAPNRDRFARTVASLLLLPVGGCLLVSVSGVVASLTDSWAVGAVAGATAALLGVVATIAGGEVVGALLRIEQNASRD